MTHRTIARYRIVYADGYADSWTHDWAHVCAQWHYELRIYGGSTWSPVRVEQVPVAELYGGPRWPRGTRR